MEKKLLGGVLILSLFLLSSCASTKVLKEHKQQVIDSESYKVWQHKFDKEKIVKLEALPGNFLSVTTVEAKKKSKAEPVLYLVDGETGSFLWNAGETNANIIAGDPYPVILDQKEQVLDIQALKRDGTTAWEMSLPLVSIAAAVDIEKKELMILGAAKTWWKGDNDQSAVFSVVSLVDGSQLWQLDLGQMKLPNVIPSTVMAPADNFVWIAVGGRAIGIDRSQQAVAFNDELTDTIAEESAPVPEWYVTEKIAALALTSGVSLFDAEKGVVWSAPITQKNAAPNSITVTDKTIVVGCHILLSERSKQLVLAYDRVNGKQLWDFVARDGIMVKWDRVQAPPKGIAVGKGSVVVSIRNSLVWLDELSGEEIRRVKLDAAEYHYALNVKRDKDNAVLFGKFHIRAHDLKTGELKWRLEDFGVSKDFGVAAQKLGQGMMKIGMQAAATMQEFSAQSMRSLASVKVAGRTGSGYNDYVLSPSSRGQLLSAAQGAERNSAWYNAASSMADLYGHSQWIELIHYNPDKSKYVSPKVIDTAMLSFSALARFVSVTVLDLQDGTYQERMTLRANDLGGFAALCIDAEADMAYFTHHAIGILCKKDRILEAYKIPK
ncbi:MAG: PQQ-binding-like beta-propeller repeat protein [PVC group bacterium]|nr:PQQ-binding-like beta-propeller repeat protein [PVC group bacterium]